jgi:4-amino-4-deoxy-L-arabinose transferase-like glycosyltransferase
MVLPMLASDPIKGLVTYADYSPYYPPMFGIAAGLAYAVFGVSPFVARATSAFFGLMTLFCAYLVASAMFNRNVAISSIVLLASTPIFLFVSTLAMHITIGLAFSLSGLYFYLRATQKPSLRIYTLAGVLESLSLLSNYIFLPICIMLTVHLLVFHERKIARIFAFSLPFLLVIPWIYYSLIVLGQLKVWAFSTSATIDAYKRHAWLDPVAWYWYLEQLPRQMGILQSLALALGLVYSIVRRTRQRVFLLIWIVSVYVAFALISNKDWRYTISFIPAMTTVIADSGWSLCGCLSSALRRFKVNRRLIRTSVLAVIIIILAASSITSSTVSPTRQVNVAIESAAAYMAGKLRYGESVVVLLASNSCSPPLVAFELATVGKNVNNVWMYPDVPIDVGITPSINTTRLLLEVKESRAHFGVLWTGSQSPMVADLAQQLAQNSGIVAMTIFGAGPSQVLVYEFALS